MQYFPDEKSISVRNPGAHFTLKISANQGFGTYSREMLNAPLKPVYLRFEISQLPTANHTPHSHPQERENLNKNI